MFDSLKKSYPILHLRRFLFERKFSTHVNVNYFRGVFKSFNEAMASAPKTKPVGYDNPDSAKMYKERGQTVYSTDYPVLLWMMKIQNQFSSVFDFGGHFGVHYYSYQKVIDFNLIQKWTICDVEQVCEEGKRIAIAEDRLGKIDFVSDISLCNHYDLFLANGSLQYLEWELHDKLISLNKLPPFLIVNMTPLHPHHETITLNNIGTAFCPYYLRLEEKFFQGLNSIGYKIVDTWRNEAKSCNIAFEPDRSLNHYQGAFLVLDRN